MAKCKCKPPYSAINAISARCDLNPANGTYPFDYLGRRNGGGIDAKVSWMDTYLKHARGTYTGCCEKLDLRKFANMLHKECNFFFSSQNFTTLQMCQRPYLHRVFASAYCISVK